MLLYISNLNYNDLSILFLKNKLQKMIKLGVNL